MSNYHNDSSHESDGDNDQSKGKGGGLPIDLDVINELLRDPPKEGARTG